MWVEAKNENLGIVNLDRICNVRVVYNRVVASTRDSEEDVYLFHGEPEEAQAAYARIRDALARGERFVSLRETEGYSNLERLRSGESVHCLSQREADLLVKQASDEGITAVVGPDPLGDGWRCVTPLRTKG